MNLPSLVRFFSGFMDLRNLDEVLEPTEALREGGPYGDGSEEAEVRAWACCRPSGSLRLWALDSKMTEPVRPHLASAFQWKTVCPYLGLHRCRR